MLVQLKCVFGPHRPEKGPVELDNKVAKKLIDEGLAVEVVDEPVSEVGQLTKQLAEANAEIERLNGELSVAMAQLEALQGQGGKKNGKTGNPE